MVRVAFFDNDNRVQFKNHLVHLLKKEPDINVVAEFGRGLAGIKAVEEQKPDVILVDSKEPFTEDLETTKRIVSKFQNTRIIFLSQDSPGGSMTVSECLVGACYPLCLHCTDKEILAAIRNGISTG
jgi:DNA-binding NarL/FixJ family response regulator